jgi:hypothetical protein
MSGNAETNEPTEKELWDQEIAASDTDAAKPGTAEPAAVVVENKPEPTPPVNAPAADPYEGLHPAIRKQLEDQALMLERLRKTEGHIGGLTSELKRTRDELAAAKAAATQVREAPTAAVVAAAQKNTEKWDQLKTDFPEWAEALEERLGNTAQPDIEGLRSRIHEDLTAQLAPKIRQELKDEIAAETEGRLVGIAHRGWRNTVNTPEFATWLKGQGTDVQTLADSSVAEDAIELLDRFQSHTGAQPNAQRIAESRKARLAEAATVARGAGTTDPVKSAADMTEKELWDFYAKNPEALARR